jgi:NADH-quinone oxidoreductase subunit M
MKGTPVLSLLILIPVVASVVVLLLPASQEKLIKKFTVAAAAVAFIASLAVATGFFAVGSAGMQMVQSVPWVPTIGMAYKVGIDGLSLPLVLLTTLLCLLCAIYTLRLDKQVKVFCFLLLLLQVGMIGVFLALDAVLFYVFWELVLVPMFFMIGIWGGENRRYASVKFFIYTLVGSVVMLLGLLLLYFWGPKTFDIPSIIAWGQAGKYTLQQQYWIFGALFLGFAVKVPIFPFHTWLPDAHVEAPTVGSVLLAGVLLKMGGYGLLRVSLAALPQAFAAFSPYLAILGVVGIVYGSAVALTQKDLKKMVAYSSVSHMGFVVLGIAAATAGGIDGAVAQMFVHGIITGMLFFLVGMIYERYHTKEIARLRGVIAAVPALGVLFTFASFASLGLPGLAGFIGEFTPLMGGLQTFPVTTAFAVIGMVLTAAYFLRTMQSVVFAPVEPDSAVYEGPRVMAWTELSAVVPLATIALAMGLYPAPFFAVVDPVARTLAALVVR